MRILVTGANGFVGKHLLDALLQQEGCDIIAAGGPTMRDEMIRRMVEDSRYPDRVQWIPMDMTDQTLVDQVIRMIRPHQVYHLAGIATTSGSDDEEYYQVNAEGTHHLAKSILTHMGDSCRLLHISSASVYGKQSSSVLRMDESHVLCPVNAYGASKAAAEMMLWPLYHQGLNMRIARPFNHTGQGQQGGFVCADLINKLKKEMKNRKSSHDQVEIEVARLDSVRDFSDVRDVVAAYVSIMDECDSGTVVNVASGRGYAIQDIVNMLHDVLEGVVEFTVVNQKINESTDTDRMVGDSSKLKLLTGWSTKVPMQDTLREMCRDKGIFG